MYRFIHTPVINIFIFALSTINETHDFSSQIINLLCINIINVLQQVKYTIVQVIENTDFFFLFNRKLDTYGQSDAGITTH